MIREVTASNGNITTVAGNGKAGYSGDGGPATSAQLNDPYGVFVDGAGNIFIADTDNAAIREVVAGIIQTVAGNGTMATPAMAVLRLARNLIFPKGCLSTPQTTFSSRTRTIIASA